MLKEISAALDNVICDETGNWFFDYKNSVLCTLDWDEFVVTQIAYLKRSKRYAHYPKAYGEIVLADGKIAVVPEAPLPIVIYDIENHEVDYIKYDIDETNFPGKVFSGAVKYNDVIYFVPCYYNAIIGLNLSSKEIRYYSLDSLYEKDFKATYLWSGYYLHDHELIFATMNDNRILSFNMEDKTSRYLVEIDGVKGFTGVFGDESRLWAVPLTADCVYEISLNDYNLINRINSFPNDYWMGEFSFSKIVDMDHKAVFLPREANMCIWFDKTKKLMLPLSPALSQDRNSTFYEKYLFYSNIVEYNSKLYLFESSSGIVNVYNKNHELTERRSLSYEKRDMPQILDSPFEMVFEDELWDAEYFVNKIMSC